MFIILGCLENFSMEWRTGSVWDVSEIRYGFWEIFKHFTTLLKNSWKVLTFLSFEMIFSFSISVILNLVLVYSCCKRAVESSKLKYIIIQGSKVKQEKNSIAGKCNLTGESINLRWSEHSYGSKHSKILMRKCWGSKYFECSIVIFCMSRAFRILLWNRAMDYCENIDIKCPSMKEYSMRWKNWRKV